MEKGNKEEGEEGWLYISLNTLCESIRQREFSKPMYCMGGGLKDMEYLEMSLRRKVCSLVTIFKSSHYCSSG